MDTSKDIYKVSDRVQAGKDFAAVFGTSIAPYYDGIVTLVFKKICIDPFKFDDRLHRLYGDYENEGKSMEGIVKEHYGEAGLKLLNKLL